MWPWSLSQSTEREERRRRKGDMFAEQSKLVYWILILNLFPLKQSSCGTHRSQSRCWIPYYSQLRVAGVNEGQGFYVFNHMFLIYFLLTSATLLFWYKIKISVLKIAFLASSAFEREPLSWSDLRERQLRQVQAHQALAIAVLQEGIRQSTAEHSLRNMDSHIPPCQHLENTNSSTL